MLSWSTSLLGNFDITVSIDFCGELTLSSLILRDAYSVQGTASPEGWQFGVGGGVKEEPLIMKFWPSFSHTKLTTLSVI